MKIKKVLLVYNPFAGNGLFKANLDRIIEMFQNAYWWYWYGRKLPT